MFAAKRISGRFKMDGGQGSSMSANNSATH